MVAENPSFCEPNWPTLSSTLLPGGYEPGEIVEADAQKARFRVRVLGDWSANAFLDAFCASGPQAQAQVALWMAARQLQNSNLSSPLAAGEFEHDAAQLIYVVAPGADESLAAVLRERAITVEEARELLVSLRRGLEYLHAHGWVHGHLAPEQVLAVGDSIRISSEYAGQINAARPIELLTAKYCAPEASGANVTPAADVWCLGATLFEALTQKSFPSNRSPEVAGLPKPFDKIVARCLDPNPQTRCTLREVADLAANRLANTAPREPLSPAVVAKPEAAPVLTRVARRERRDNSSIPRLWIYAGALVVVVLLLLWAAWPKRQPPPATQTVSALQTVPDPVVPPSKNVWETKTLKPNGNAPVRPALPAPADLAKLERRSPLTVNGPVWRVVVFTYAREADAEKKAELVNKRHPNLDAKVFSPKPQESPYLVTVGGRMTREEAARLRQRAIGMGLPRDSYIQNYRQ